MQFALEVIVSECYFLKHNQGILGINQNLWLAQGSLDKLDCEWHENVLIFSTSSSWLDNRCRISQMSTSINSPDPGIHSHCSTKHKTSHTSLTIVNNFISESQVSMKTSQKSWEQNNDQHDRFQNCTYSMSFYTSYTTMLSSAVPRQLHYTKNCI
jgi:hypothetical protein